MIDPIVEEALSSLIKRVDRLEESVKNFIKNFNQNPPIKADFNKIGLATEGQINYIRGLGGNPNTEMTKAEAGILIDELLKAKKPDSVETEINEPKEVNTDDAGIGEGDLL